MKKRCYIAGAGEFDERVLPGADDFVIAADGGYAALEMREIAPDLIVGDFDSLASDLTKDVLKKSNVIRTPAEKDDTDMMLAVSEALSQGYKDFIINGGLGGRLDHTLANIQTLVYLKKQGARGTLVGRNEFITVIKNEELKLIPDKKRNSTLSIFSAGCKAEGITLKGLKYPLTNATLKNDNPVGISNETTGKPASVSVSDGIIIIIYDGGYVKVHLVD